MGFIDYNFFPVLFFLGWNIFTAKQFMPNIERYGFVRNENKDLSVVKRQTKFANNMKNSSNFLDLLQTELKSPASNTYVKQDAAADPNKLNQEIKLHNSRKEFGFLETSPLRLETKKPNAATFSLLLNFYRLTGKYNHDLNNQKPVTNDKNYLKYQQSQNLQHSFAFKTQLKPMSLNKSILSSISVFNDLLNYTYQPKDSIIFSSKSVNQLPLEIDIKNQNVEFPVKSPGLIGLNSLNQIESFYFIKPNIFENWINKCRKFSTFLYEGPLIKLKTNNNYLIENPSLYRLLNNHKGLSFFSNVEAKTLKISLGKPTTKHGQLVDKNKTFYYNQFDSLVPKSGDSYIFNKIQKHRAKTIKLLLQTPTQKIESLQKFQIPLCFSKIFSFNPINTKNLLEDPDNITLKKNFSSFNYGNHSLWNKTPESFRQSETVENLIPSTDVYEFSSYQNNLYSSKTSFFKHIASSMRPKRLKNLNNSLTLYGGSWYLEDKNLIDFNTMSIYDISIKHTNSKELSILKSMKTKNNLEKQQLLEFLDFQIKTRNNLKESILKFAIKPKLKLDSLLNNSRTPNEPSNTNYFLAHKLSSLGLHHSNSYSNIYPFKYNDYNRYNFQCGSMPSFSQTSVNNSTENHRDAEKTENLQYGFTFLDFKNPILSKIYAPFLQPANKNLKSFIEKKIAPSIDPNLKSLIWKESTNYPIENNNEAKKIAINQSNPTITSFPKSLFISKPENIKKPSIFFSSFRNLPYYLYSTKMFSTHWALKKPRPSANLVESNNSKIYRKSNLNCYDNSTFQFEDSSIYKSFTIKPLSTLIKKEIGYKMSLFSNFFANTSKISSMATEKENMSKSYHDSENNILHTIKHSLDSPFKGVISSYGKDSSTASNNSKWTIFPPLFQPLKYRLVDLNLPRTGLTHFEFLKIKNDFNVNQPNHNLNNFPNRFSKGQNVKWNPLNVIKLFHFPIPLSFSDYFRVSVESNNRLLSFTDNKSKNTLSKLPNLASENKNENLGNYFLKTGNISPERMHSKVVISKNTINVSENFDNAKINNFIYAEPIMNFKQYLGSLNSKFSTVSQRQKYNIQRPNELNALKGIQVFGVKPLLKTRTIHGPPLKNQKESISLPNYLKNITNQNYQNFSPNHFSELYIVFWILFSKTIFIYLALHYLRKFMTFLGTSYMSNLFKIFVTMKFIDGNILSIIKTFQDYNFQLNQQNIIDTKVNTQLKTIKRN